MFDNYTLIHDLHEDVFCLFLSVTTLDRYLFGLVKFFVDKYLFEIKNYFSDFNQGYCLFNFIFILFAGFIYNYAYFVLKSLGNLNIKVCLSILLELISFFCNTIFFIIGIFSCCIFIIARVNGELLLIYK
ncbi:hypothetical protein GNY89_01385 [Borrelia miyamotoi]|nr:hypothetical protein GNY89_01385 [Borrelia miyamotoi]